jgi:hypothetical protein
MTAPAAAAGTLWHITLILSGDPEPLSQVGPAVRRLCDLDPGNMGARYRSDRAEVQFWDEGGDIGQVALAASRLWRTSRADTGLPDWSLVGMQVMERGRLRERRAATISLFEPGSVGPLR